MFARRFLRGNPSLGIKIIVCSASIALITLFIISCSEEGPSDPAENSSADGSIQVTVKDYYGFGIPNAEVMTSPATADGLTNIIGKCQIDGIAPGTYRVMATVSGYGSGSSNVTVVANQVTDVNVVVLPGVYLEPLADILSPAWGTQFSPVDTVTFRASVGDLEDDATDLDIYWRSNRDETLNTDPASALGIAQFSTYSLSLGVHTISLRVTDTDGLEARDTVQVEIKHFSPDVQIILPAAPAEFTPGDLIAFQARVSDRETETTSLTVEWSSDHDGVLDTNPPGADSLAGFSTSTLTTDVHLIRLRVTDGDANTTTDSIEVSNVLPVPVTLSPLQKDYNSVNLTWTQSSDPYFYSYEVYRSTSPSGGGSLLTTIPGAATTTYEDSDVNFGQIYYYWVRIVNTQGYGADSNRESVTAGKFVYIGTHVERMMADPARSYIYAVDRVNNNLLFINTTTETVEKTIFIGSNPVDLDIDASGDSLYVANFGSTEIAIVDLVSQTKARSVYVLQNPYRIECGTQGRLVYCEEDQWCDIILIDTDTGAELSNVSWGAYEPDLEMAPDGTSLYAGESGLSGSNIYRWNIVADSLVLTDETPGYGYSYAERMMVMSGNGLHLHYAARKILAATLSSELGTFADYIYAVTPDGSLAFGEDYIYNADTYLVITGMPVNSKVLAVSPDGNTLFIYDPVSAVLFIYDVSGL